MIHRVIIRPARTDPRHWDACFQDAPHVAFGGDSPSTAARRLVEAHPERGIEREGPWVFESPGHIEIDFEGSDVVTDRAELRAAFARFCGCISQDAGRSP